jgi:hypothetical protein
MGIVFIIKHFKQIALPAPLCFFFLPAQGIEAVSFFASGKKDTSG